MQVTPVDGIHSLKLVRSGIECSRFKHISMYINEEKDKYFDQREQVGNNEGKCFFLSFTSPKI